MAKRIQLLRKAKKLTQAELAAQIGLRDTAIRSYENGLREPNSKAMAALERFFDVSGAYLRGETDDAARDDWENPSRLSTIDEGRNSLVEAMSSRLSVSSPKVRSLVDSMLVELKFVLAQPDNTILEAQVEMLYTAFMQSSLFSEFLIHRDVQDEVMLNRKRTIYISEISDAMTKAQAALGKKG